jgi:hypothetical protein
MASTKDVKFNMMMSAEDKEMLTSLAVRDDVSEAQIMRTLIKRAYAEVFPQRAKRNQPLRP